MSVSLRQLKAFSAVAQSGSFVDASRLLHVTPAAVSAHVRELEGVVGFRLFDRTTRKVSLSDAGRQYSHYAERVLADLRKAELFADDLCARRTGVVRIAMTQVMNWVLLPPVFRGFQQRWPQIRIELVDVPTHEIIASVETGEADLAVSFQVPVREIVEATPLFSSMVHAVVPADHAFAKRRRLAWADLADDPVIFIGRGAEMRIRAELPARIRLRTRYEASNTISALSLVASGAGIAICAGYVWPMARLHQLGTVQLTAPVANHPFMLYRNRSLPMSPAVQAYRDHLIAHYAPLADKPIERSLGRQAA